MAADRFAYLDKNGHFDYDYYRRIQIDGNKRKLLSQWVEKETIRFLSDHILSSGDPPRFGICHGTRSGAEQAWFRDFLPGCDVLGTEISDTATNYPNTVQHDFHEVRDDWVGRCDFVYSNSWDHSYDPAKMFNVWSDQLAPHGRLFLEHTSGHEVATELDPFGIDLEGLKTFVAGIDPGRLTFDSLLEVPAGLWSREPVWGRVRYLVMRRAT